MNRTSRLSANRSAARGLVAVLLFVAGFALACVPRGSSAQLYYDPFNYPAATTIPNWQNEFGGDWVATGQDVRSDVTRGWQFLLRDNVYDRDCVVETVVSYSNPANTQFGGPSARGVIDRNNSLITYLAKVQDNVRGGSGSFNRAFLFLYQSPLGFFGLSTVDFNPSTVVRTRLLVTDDTATGQVRVMGFFDTTMDGVWNARLIGFNFSLGKVQGQPGLAGFGAVLQDDFKFFNAVLWESTGLPSLGETVTYNARGRPGAIYVGACSFSNSGFRLGPVTVPLWPDELFALSVQVPSIFRNFAGVLDANGDAQMEIDIPNDPVLTGVAYYTAFVTLSGGQILEVSNDAQVRIGG